MADVFLALWRWPAKFDLNRGSLLIFLRMKARGRSIDIVRSDTCRRGREQTELSGGHAPSQPADVVLLAHERVLDLRGAVASLPECEREAVHLAYFGGMTYQAVSLHLGVPEGTVKSRIRSGLQRLREDAQWSLDDEMANAP